MDTGYPDKRIDYILHDAQVKLLITTKNTLKTTLIAKENIISLEKIKASLSMEPGSKPTLAPGNKDDLCYVIYTSGTTGKPKGVAISQGPVINYVKTALQLYGVNKKDKTPYFSEFDLVTINDRVSLNRESIIQTHLYEDRIFKMSSITLESDVSVGDRSILLYGTLMKKYSTLDSLSLLMKGEILYPLSHWEGIPAKRIYCSRFKDKVW